MALQSVWYFTDLPEDVVDIVERDLTETFSFFTVLLTCFRNQVKDLVDRP